MLYVSMDSACISVVTMLSMVICACGLLRGWFAG
jgi:hypothetical protein